MLIVVVNQTVYTQFQTYQTEIPQEDGTDVEETVDEAKNILKVSSLHIALTVLTSQSHCSY
jgi:hypothetical protein